MPAAALLGTKPWILALAQNFRSLELCTHQLADPVSYRHREQSARRIAQTITLSRQTYAVLWQNIALALGIKAVFLVLALMGTATMWMAVFADMGASLLVVFNGLRLLRK